MTVTFTALRSRQDSCRPWKDDSLAFVCLFSDDASPYFPWELPLAACFAKSHQQIRQFVMHKKPYSGCHLSTCVIYHAPPVCCGTHYPYTILMACKICWTHLKTSQPHSLKTHSQPMRDPGNRNQRIYGLSPYLASEACGNVCHLVARYTVTSTGWLEGMITASQTEICLSPTWFLDDLTNSTCQTISDKKPGAMFTYNKKTKTQWK